MGPALNLSCITDKGGKMKAAAVFVIIVLALSSLPAFADEGKKAAHPWSPFNIIGDFVTGLGEGKDGKSIWDVEHKKTTQTAEEIKERRRTMGQ